MSCALHCFAMGAILCVYFLFLSTIAVSLSSFCQVQVPHPKSQFLAAPIYVFIPSVDPPQTLVGRGGVNFREVSGLFYNT